MKVKNKKPFACKNYGSIPHLLASKLGEGDHHIHEGQDRILTVKVRDKYDIVTVTEKYDGSNVGVGKLNGKIISLARSGYEANTSPYEQHHIFSEWVKKNEHIFSELLNEGERIVGEWLLVATGMTYEIKNNVPFLAFDIFDANNKRKLYHESLTQFNRFGINSPNIISRGNKAFHIDDAKGYIHIGSSYAKHIIKSKEEKPEGVVYRMESKNHKTGLYEFRFMAKYVRHDFENGKYLSDISGKETVYNMNPKFIGNLI